MPVITTTTLSIGRGKPDVDRGVIRQAAGVLRRGGLVAFPTETVYGLGALAFDRAAVARIFEAKGRPATNPLIVHGADVKMVRTAVLGWTLDAARLARKFWPGPLTLVVPRSQVVPDLVTAGLGSVGVRVPDSLPARILLWEVGAPVAAPSANRSTGVSPTRAAHVAADLDGRIDLILDGGPCPLGIESTVLDLTTPTPTLLRPGAITRDQLTATLGREVALHCSAGDGATPAASPGQSAVHYAPRTPLVRLDPTRLDGVFPLPPVRRIGLIVIGHDLPATEGRVVCRVDWPNPVIASRDLYETLRRWDDGSLDLIDVVPPPDTDAWRAVNDRVWRASRRWARPGT